MAIPEAIKPVKYYFAGFFLSSSEKITFLPMELN